MMPFLLTLTNPLMRFVLPLRSTLVCLCLLAILAPSLAFADAEAPPDAAAILAASRQASGGDALLKWSGYRRVGTLTGKLAGRELNPADSQADLLVDFGKSRYLERFSVGTAQASEGFDGYGAWRVSLAGKPIAGKAPERAQGKVLAFLRSGGPLVTDPQRMDFAWSRVAPCADTQCDVLVFHPTGLPDYEFWLRQNDHLLAAVAILNNDGKAIYQEQYSAWANVAGVRFPEHIHIQSKDRDMQLQARYEAQTAVMEAAFSMPSMANKTQWKLPEGKDHVDIPFIVQDDKILLPIKLGDKTFQIMFDTGADLVLGNKAIEQIGLKPEMVGESIGVGSGSEKAGVVAIASMTLGDLQRTNAIIQTSDYDFDRTVVSGKQPCDGLLGADLLRQFAVHIDFDHQILTLISPTRFHYAGVAQRIPMRQLDNTQPLIDGEIEGHAATLMLDTGSAGNLMVNSPFVQQNDLLYHLRTTREIQTGRGLGGAVYGRLANIETLKLGYVHLPVLGASLARMHSGMLANERVAGVVGYGVLRRFNITFDTAGGAIYLEPNSHYSDLDPYAVPQNYFQY